MKLATIPFANAAPFFHRLPAAWLARQELVQESPRDLGDLARAGKVDAGLFSLVDVWDLEAKGLFEPLGNLGIAGKGSIGSILLFGCRDPKELEGQAIAVTGQSATTVKLLEVWLREKAGVKGWKLVPLGAGFSGPSLLIGDQALARSLSLSPGEPKPLDLCAEWTAWTGLPFVFARWAVRQSLPEADKEGLDQAIAKSLKDSQEDGMKDLAAHLSRQTGFPAPFLADYLSGIRYVLGNSEMAGMDLFKRKLESRA